MYMTVYRIIHWITVWRLRRSFVLFNKGGSLLLGASE
jgi:hypothetical protein